VFAAATDAKRHYVSGNFTEYFIQHQHSVMKEKIIDSLKVNQPIKVKIIEEADKFDWNVWFLAVAVLSLIAAVILPFAQKKYEESKSKYAFHLYVKKKFGIIFNMLTYDLYTYKHIKDAQNLDNLNLTFDNIIYRFEKDYKENKNSIHPLFAFGVLLNFQDLLFTVKRIQYVLNTIDLKDIDEKSLEYGDKLSKKEHNKLSAILLLIEHYYSITNFHDKFSSLKSIKREIKDKQWIGLKVEGNVLKEQNLIMEDLAFLRENEISIEEIIKTNKLLIQELKSYFDYEKLKKKRKK